MSRQSEKFVPGQVTGIQLDSVVEVDDLPRHIKDLRYRYGCTDDGDLPDAAGVDEDPARGCTPTEVSDLPDNGVVVDDSVSSKTASETPANRRETEPQDVQLPRRSERVRHPPRFCFDD